jgi:hypothetical protein
MLRCLALIALVGCISAESMGEVTGRRPRLDGEGVVALPSDDPRRYHLRYVDGQVSANDACAVRLDSKLNPKIPPVYVNGRPIGFC